MSRDGDALKFALLDDSEWVRLYQTNVTFRAGIDSLVDLLPIWTEGLASYSKRQDEKLQGTIEALKRTTITSDESIEFHLRYPYPDCVEHGCLMHPYAL